jgi:hypothetical protein
VFLEGRTETTNLEYFYARLVPARWKSAAYSTNGSLLIQTVR